MLIIAINGRVVFNLRGDFMNVSKYLVKCFDVDRNVVMHVICSDSDLSDIVDMCKGKTFVTFVKVIALDVNSEVSDSEI